MEEDMEEDHFPYAKRMKKPYVLLIDPPGTRAAVYDHGHRLMHEEASAKLLAFALQRAPHRAAWDDALDDWPRPRAAWMPTGSLSGWTLLWLRDGSSTAQHLRDTPDR